MELGDTQTSGPAHHLTALVYMGQDSHSKGYRGG